MTRNPLRLFSLPLLPYVVSLLTGATAGGLEQTRDAISVTLAFFTLLTAALARQWIHLSKKAFLCVTGCLLVAFFSVHILIHPVLPSNHVVHFSGRKTWIIEGVIQAPFDPGLTQSHLTVKVRGLLTHDQHRIPACGRLRVTVYGPYTQTLYVGDVIRFVSTISKIRPPANPYSFDYDRFLALRRIYATAHIHDFSRLVVIKTGSSPGWQGLIDRLRQHLNRWITSTIPSPYNALASAFLIGYRGQVPSSIRETFVHCGTSHLIAISGLHLGIVSVFLFLLIRRLLSFFPKIFLYVDIQRITAGLTFACLLFYLVLTGGRISTIRAFIMAGAFLAVLFFRRTSRLTDILLLAAFLILFFQPQAAYFTSFQLTFAAVGGILLGLGYRKNYKNGGIQQEEKSPFKKTLSWIATTFLLTLLAMAGTFPIATYHFHQTSPLAILANLFGIPYVAFVMLPIGLTSLIIYPFSGSIATVLLKLDGVLIMGLVQTFRFFSKFPYSKITVFPPRWFEIILYYGMFIFLVLMFGSKNQEARKRNAFLAAGCMGFLVVTSVLTHINMKPKITVFSVKKGTYLAISRKDGQASLICNGLGGSPYRDDARWVLLPYLLHERIRKIKALVVANDEPVNLRTVVSLVRYWSPGCLLGPPSVLYALKTELGNKMPPTKWRQLPVSPSSPPPTIRLETRVNNRKGILSAVFLTFQHLAITFLTTRKSFSPSLKFGPVNMFITPDGGNLPSPYNLSCNRTWIVTYPCSRKRRRRVILKRAIDLRRDGAVVLERLGKSWHLKTTLSHRTGWVH